jgi:Bacterial capsule synthesis protein PGA_cap
VLPSSDFKHLIGRSIFEKMLKLRSFSILLIICTSAAAWGCEVTLISDHTTKFTDVVVDVKPTPIPQTTELITIAAGGDIMLGSTFPNETRMPPKDGADLLKVVAPIFQAADIAFGNLEGPMIDGGISTKCPPPKPVLPGEPIPKVNCFAFRVPTRYGKYLKEAGFDVLSLANNHAGDFGNAGRTSTRKVLDSLGIKHAGSDKGKFATTIVEAKGKKIAFIGFAHNNIVPNVNNLAVARQLVQQANKKADLVVVSFHGGAEGVANTRVPQTTEIFFGEKRGNLPLFARTVIDAGADLVLGHGPHVLRGMEIYKDRLIAYSMGNFATYGWFQLSGPTAETMVLEVQIDKEGKFVSGKVNPFKLEDRGILTKDESNSAIYTLRRLSQLDFPATAPKIADDGTISK